MFKFKNFFIVIFYIFFLFPVDKLKAEENINFNFGKNIDQNIITKIDITIDSRGSNLPQGDGSAKEGIKIFTNKCRSCHLEKDFLNEKSILNKNNFSSVPINLAWKNSLSLYDYIRKAMPYNKPQSLTDNETYALMAYLLFKNNKISIDKKIDKEFLLNLDSNFRNIFHENWDKNKIKISSDDKTSKILFYLSQKFYKKNVNIDWYDTEIARNELKEKILSQDISISPTSNNLPEGSGSAEIGEKIYQKQCLSCHGTEGKAEELSRRVESLRGGHNSIKIIAFESLSGGLGSLSSEMPVRSVGSYWQHATTLFDYIRRAMPYNSPQSLTNNETYAVTAYILYINNIINKQDIINSKNIQKIKMPNQSGFLDSWGPDWWRAWIDKKYSIIFSLFLLAGILTITLLSKKLSQYKKRMKYIRFYLTGAIFLWFGIIHGIQIGTQKIYQSYNIIKNDNGIWEMILFDPIYIILVTFIIIATVLFGKGIFCGWICPFGFIQDLIKKASTAIKFDNIEVPEYLHNKLIYLKYIILTLILLSVIYTTGNNILLEFEPFNTIIVYSFNTSTILILWALLILGFVFFIERGFCKYLCPTGASLAIIGQFQVINWLNTIKSCGDKSCQTCYPSCPTKAIRIDGSINSKECIQCLSCQIVFNDKNIRCKNKIRKSSIKSTFIKNKSALGLR